MRTKAWASHTLSVLSLFRNRIQPDRIQWSFARDANDHFLFLINCKFLSLLTSPRVYFIGNNFWQVKRVENFVLVSVNSEPSEFSLFQPKGLPLTANWTTTCSHWRIAKKRSKSIRATVRRTGLAYASLNDHAKAKQFYEKAIKLGPYNESFRNNLRIAEEKALEHHQLEKSH